MVWEAGTDGSDRIPVTDVETMRGGARRLVRTAIITLFLLTFFTAGGTAMLRAGEAPALPFAVGGPISQLGVLGMVVAAFRVRMTLADGSVSRRASMSARRLLAALRTVLLTTLAGLAVYAVIRLVAGDSWTLLTTAMIGLVLWMLARGMASVRDGIDQGLNLPPPPPN